MPRGRLRYRGCPFTATDRDVRQGQHRLRADPGCTLLTQVQGKLEFKRHNTSQLIAIDISDLKNPKVLQTVDIIGSSAKESRARSTTHLRGLLPEPELLLRMVLPHQSERPAEGASLGLFLQRGRSQELVLVDQLQVFQGGSYSIHDPHYDTSVSSLLPERHHRCDFKRADGGRELDDVWLGER